MEQKEGKRRSIFPESFRAFDKFLNRLIIFILIVRETRVFTYELSRIRKSMFRGAGEFRRPSIELRITYVQIGYPPRLKYPVYYIYIYIYFLFQVFSKVPSLNYVYQAEICVEKQFNLSYPNKNRAGLRREAFEKLLKAFRNAEEQDRILIEGESQIGRS